MKCLDRRYWCRTRSSKLFLGCPIDLMLVDKSRLKNNLSSDTSNRESEDNEVEDDDAYDDDDEEEDRMFNFVEKYVEEKYGSLFYLDRAIVGPDLSDWESRNEVFLAIYLPSDCTIPGLTNFFTNFDSSVLDQFRTLMNLLGQSEEDSEPELCSCQDNIG